MEWVVGVVRLTESWNTERDDVEYTLDDAAMKSLPLQTDLVLYYPANHPEPPRRGVAYEVVLREVA